MPVTVNGTNGLVFNDGSTQVTSPFSGGFGFRNRIINGAMVIDQRNAGASQTITGGASPLAFNCDRWQVRSQGSNATVRQIVTNNTYRMRFTGLASNSGVAASQSIEALNCVDLAGGTATLSLVASSTSLTSLTLEAYYANTTNAFGTWTSPTVTSIGTQSVSISSTESTISWTFSVPSAATTGIQIRITGGALLATQTLTIGNVQLEKGSTATSFDFRSITTELQLCQRYYALTGPVTVSNQTGATVFCAGGANFPVTMRATPTITSGTGTSAASDVYAVVGISVAAFSATNSGTIRASIEL